MGVEINNPSARFWGDNKVYFSPPKLRTHFLQFLLGIENYPSAFFWGGVGVTQQGVFWLNVKVVHALAFCSELVLAREAR